MDRAAAYFNDGINRIEAMNFTAVSGPLLVLAGSRDHVMRKGRQYVNGNLVEVADPTSLYPYSAETVRLGRAPGSSGSNYLNAEVHAIAVFRRALSQREIKVITDYYQNLTKPLPYIDPEDTTAWKTRVANRLGVSSDSAALDILRDAPFYVDARASRSGERYADNLGWRGSELNLRYGSAQSANSNDPLLLKPEAAGYVYLPGVASNYLSVPDDVALNITNAIDIIVRAVPDDWTPSATSVLVSKKSGALGAGYQFSIYTDAKLIFSHSDGVTNIESSSTAISPFADGYGGWLRVTYDDAANEVKFYTAADSDSVPNSWTQLGNTVTTTQPIVSSATVLKIGERGTSGLNLAAKIYRAIVKSGVDGTTVLDINCDGVVDGRQTSFLAATGQVVSINRSATGRKTVVMPNTTVKTIDAANVYLPGVVGNYLSTPDAAALDITGDITLTVKVALDDWTPVSGAYVLSKMGDTTGTRSWQLYVGTGGLLQIRWYKSNGTLEEATSTIANTFTDGTTAWIRTVLDVDNGAGQWAVDFYTSTDGTTWTRLGNQVVGTTGVSNVANSTSPVEVGTRVNGTVAVSVGRFYRAIVASGLHTSSTPVLDIDCANAIAGQSTFAATTGQTVTINSTANSGLRINAQKTGAGKPCWLLGTDDYFEIEGDAQHGIIDIAPGKDSTTICALRSWTTANSTTFFGKKGGTPASMPGWQMGRSALNDYVLSHDGVQGYSITVPHPPGEHGTIAAVRYLDTTRKVAARFAAAATIANDQAAVTMNNMLPTRIGRSSSDANYSDTESFAFAKFDRALTANEISILTAFFSA